MLSPDGPRAYTACTEGRMEKSLIRISTALALALHRRASDAAGGLAQGADRALCQGGEGRRVEARLMPVED
jgi:hypothetical protein